jgi:menaquinone-dependent protoporphyrinogen oxidase
MSNKILVAYASRAGSTGEVAKVIATTLGESGAAVEVKPIKSVTSLTEYDAVVVGSAIRMGKWLPEAVEFVKTNQSVLQEIPTAYFTVCLTLHEDTEANRATVAAYTEPVRALRQPDWEAFFAGTMDYSSLSFFDRLMARAVRAPQGDWRDWTAIQSWARDLQTTLLQAS